jgi:hypothetical protein
VGRDRGEGFFIGEGGDSEWPTLAIGFIEFTPTATVLKNWKLVEEVKREPGEARLSGTHRRCGAARIR